MRPVVPCILDDEEDRDLVGHCKDGWKWDRCAKTNVDGHRVEEPNSVSHRVVNGQRISYHIWGSSTVKWESRTSLAQFHCSCAVGTFCWEDISIGHISEPGRSCLYILNLVFVEVTYVVDNDPGQRAAKVDNFVHQKGHDASSENVVLHVGVPRSPQALEDVEMDIVFGDFIKLAPVSVLGHEKRGGCGVPAEIVRAMLGKCVFGGCHSTHIATVVYQFGGKERMLVRRAE